MSRITPDGFDRVGPFHPYLAWGAVIALDLVIVAVLLAAVTALGDRVEDWLFPGGTEWVTVI